MPEEASGLSRAWIFKNSARQEAFITRPNWEISPRLRRTGSVHNPIMSLLFLRPMGRCLPALLRLAPVRLLVPLLVPWNQYQLILVVHTGRDRKKKRDGKLKTRESYDLKKNKPWNKYQNREQREVRSQETHWITPQNYKNLNHFCQPKTWKQAPTPSFHPTSVIVPLFSLNLSAHSKKEKNSEHSH